MCPAKFMEWSAIQYLHKSGLSWRFKKIIIIVGWLEELVAQSFFLLLFGSKLGIGKWWNQYWCCLRASLSNSWLPSDSWLVRDSLNYAWGLHPPPLPLPLVSCHPLGYWHLTAGGIDFFLHPYKSLSHGYYSLLRSLQLIKKNFSGYGKTRSFESPWVLAPRTT